MSVEEAVDWFNLCAAHTSVASYSPQLQKEVFIIRLVYQMAGWVPRGLLLHCEDQYLSWFLLLF